MSNSFCFDGRTFDYSVGVKARRFSSAWVNQQVACAACAAAQGDAPGSQAGFERLRSTNLSCFNALTSGASGRLRLDDDATDDLYMAALGSWVWPDTSSDENGLIVLLGDDTWNLFTFEFSEQTQVELAGRGLVRLNTLEQDQTWAKQTQGKKVWIVPHMAFINSRPDKEDLLARVKNTILGWNLNYSNPSSPTALDRRVDNRTAAFHTASLAFTHLQAVVDKIKSTQNKGDEDLEHPRLEILTDFIRETLRATGFWSLWAHGFDSAINNPNDPLWNGYTQEARRTLLYRLFVQYEIDQRSIGQIRESKDAPIPAEAYEDGIVIQMVFPGTDFDRIPF